MNKIYRTIGYFAIWFLLLANCFKYDVSEPYFTATFVTTGLISWIEFSLVDEISKIL